MKFKVERVCRTDSMSAIPRESIRFDLPASAKALEALGTPVELHELYLIVRMDSMDITVYPSGRVLLHPLNDKTRAKELAQRLFEMMVRE